MPRPVDFFETVNLSRTVIQLLIPTSILPDKMFSGVEINIGTVYLYKETM